MSETYNTERRSIIHLYKVKNRQSLTLLEYQDIDIDILKRGTVTRRGTRELLEF